MQHNNNTNQLQQQQQHYQMQQQISQTSSVPSPAINGTVSVIPASSAASSSSSISPLSSIIPPSVSDWRAQNEAGMLLHRSGLFEQALDHLILAVQHGPTDNNNIARKNYAIVKVDLGTRSKLAGNIDLSISCYLDAISVYPSYAPAYFNLAVIYSERGQYEAALKYYQLAVHHNPNYVEALTNIGVIYKNSAQLTMAIEYYEKALKVNPNFHIAASNLAIALTDWATQIKNEGKLDEAIIYYKRALHHNSKYPASWYNLGVAYAEKGRFDDAKVCYEMAVLFDSKCAEAYNNLGVIYKDRGNLDQAIHYYHEALAANPSFSQTLNNISVIYTMLGKLEEAYEYCSRAIKTNPHYGEAWNNMGVLFRDEGRIEEALHSYAECLRIDPLSKNAAQNKLLALNSLTQVEPLLRLPGTPAPTTSSSLHPLTASNGSISPSSSTTTPRTFILPPSFSSPSMLSPTSQSSSSSSSSPASASTNVSMSPLSYSLSSSSASSSSPSAFTTTSLSASSLLALPPAAASFLASLPPPPTPEADQLLMDTVFESHRQWGSSFLALYDRDRYTDWSECKKIKDRILRIGYISADFFIHSVSYFIEGPLYHRDSAKTHVTCYSNVARRDKKTFYFERLCDSWKSIFEKNSKEAAEMIRRDRIDILIELTGHTAGNRLDVMALKPAPIQITWIGYPNTTGLSTIDYRLTDEIVDPLDTTQRYTEALVRVPGPFLCYTPAPDAPPVTDTAALKNGYITFGSFNNLAKVNDRVLSIWAAILHAVPGSRMLMKCKPFASPTVVNKMQNKFAAMGITADRIDLISLLPTTTEHLEAYSAVDISVDTFPYAGTTTTCEALYMGVPVITYQKLYPSQHSHNVGATLLCRLESVKALCIAHNELEYIQCAINLASDIQRLQQIRKSLRDEMKNSSLCDGPTFVRGLETIYQQLWEKYCLSSDNKR